MSLFERVRERNDDNYRLRTPSNTANKLWMRVKMLLRIHATFIPFVVFFIIFLLFLTFCDIGNKTRPGVKQKKRNVERKKHEEKNFDAMVEIKKLWEISRKKDKKIKKEERQENLAKLLELCKGKMLEVIFPFFPCSSLSFSPVSVK